jgi:hypothetical protein
MNLIQRIQLLKALRNYMLSADESWVEAKQNANYYNAWFLPEFINLSLKNLAESLLHEAVIHEVVTTYTLQDKPKQIKTVGLVMAGNIPLVGFHDMICVFLLGHKQVIKPSSKDQVLIKHLVAKLTEWDAETGELIQFSEALKGCDAYIATGSNHSARYFEQYFAKYPHIIRKNRTSIAILDGTETAEELSLLADDIQLYFGLGCRNVTQVWVPADYNFQPLLDALDKYDYLLDLHKYKHNYDYVLTINMMNRTEYKTNGSIVLSPNSSPFSGISSVNYAYYNDLEELISSLDPDTLQVIVGHGFTAFGQAQCPGFFDYADGFDTMRFLVEL